MKTRQGFVSNSSSSSFVCNVYPSDYNKYKATDLAPVKKKLEDMLECMKKLGMLAEDVEFSHVFQEPKRASKADIKELREGWEFDIKWNDQMFLINSASDNTIPYEFYELICSVFNAERVHLG